MKTGCKAVHEFTYVQCKDCKFSLTTVETWTRDCLKEITHSHIRETGHTVLFIDSVELIPDPDPDTGKDNEDNDADPDDLVKLVS